MATKKIPLRKCIGCQEMKNKKELIRVVRNDAGEISLDSTGKKPGRGAYVCPNAECLNKACKSKGLDRSFKTSVPQSVYEELKMQLENINEETDTFSTITLSEGWQDENR